jgi:NAD(P)-dependent dehydrogenase (short-subunit alcohol dehydrogenase family)
VAVITGGGGDIGGAIGVELAQRGATVVLADIDTDRASEFERHVDGSDGRVVVESVDLSDPDSTRDLIRRVIDRFGSIGALVNAAAVTRRGRIGELPDDAWDRLVAVNLSSVFWACRATIPHMIRSGGGVIVNIGSLAALRGLPGSPAYAATKGGVVALSRALAVDHARDGIRVFSVNPPAVDTRLYQAMFAGQKDPAAARRSYEESQDLGRVLTTDEVAAQTVFLIEGRGPPFSPEPLVC